MMELLVHNEPSLLRHAQRLLNVGLIVLTCVLGRDDHVGITEYRRHGTAMAPKRLDVEPTSPAADARKLPRQTGINVTTPAQFSRYASIPEDAEVADVSKSQIALENRAHYIHMSTVNVVSARLHIIYLL